MNLKKEGKKAVKWSILDKFLKRGVQFILSVILARLLQPEDFGVIAMAAIFVGWGEVFRDFGLGQALVQSKNVTEVHSSTIFHLNMIMGCVVAAILFVISPYVGEFYDNEMVVWVVRVAGINFIINGLNVVQNSLLNKELNFKVGTISSFLAAVLSGMVGIVLAYLGFGVWSLLIQSLVSSVIATIYIWAKSRWRPRLIFNFKKTAPLFKKGTGFMGQALVDNIMGYAGIMAIGKMFSPGILGIYDRGNSLAEMANSTFVLPMTRPLFPLFSKLQDDLNQLRSMYIKTLYTLNWLLILIAGILLLCSHEIVCLLLGDKWEASGEYLFLLSWIIPLYPNWAISTSLWKGLGLVKKVTFITFFEKSLFLLSILALFLGLREYALCIIAANYIANILKASMTARIIGVSLWEQYREWFLEMAIVVIAFAICSSISSDSHVINMIMKMAIFLGLYIGVGHCKKIEGYLTSKNQIYLLLKSIGRK